MYCWCTIGFQDCNEAFALHRFTFHRLRCNFALVQTWNHIYMHYALCSVHNGAENIICISLWTGTGSNFQAYWLDSHPPSHLHLCLCTFLLHCSKRAQKTKTSSSYWGLFRLSRRKLNLRRKHCDGDCFWRRVDWEANLKPISFFRDKCSRTETPASGNFPRAVQDIEVIVKIPFHKKLSKKLRQFRR